SGLAGCETVPKTPRCTRNCTVHCLVHSQSAGRMVAIFSPVMVSECCEAFHVQPIESAPAAEVISRTRWLATLLLGLNTENFGFAFSHWSNPAPTAPSVSCVEKTFSAAIVTP